jgi:hypothetical protein
MVTVLAVCLIGVGDRVRLIRPIAAFSRKEICDSEIKEYLSTERV